MAFSQTDFATNNELDKLISNTVEETINAGVVLDWADVAENIDEKINSSIEAEIQKHIPSIVAAAQTHLAARTSAPSAKAHLPRTTLSGEAPRRIYGGKTRRSDDSSSSSSSSSSSLSSDDPQNSKVFANMPVLRKIESIFLSEKKIKLINELGINTSCLKNIMIKLAFPQNKNIRERALLHRFIWNGPFAFALHTRQTPTVLTEFVNEVNQYFVFNSVYCHIENKKNFLNIISLTQDFPADKNPEDLWDKLARQFLEKKPPSRKRRIISSPNESFHPSSSFSSSSNDQQNAKSFADMPVLKKIDRIKFSDEKIELINKLGINISLLNDIMINLGLPGNHGGSIEKAIRTFTWHGQFAVRLRSSGATSPTLTEFLNEVNRYFMLNSVHCYKDDKQRSLDIISLTQHFPADKNPEYEWDQLALQFLEKKRSSKRPCVRRYPNESFHPAVPAIILQQAPNHLPIQNNTQSAQAVSGLETMSLFSGTARANDARNQATAVTTASATAAALPTPQTTPIFNSGDIRNVFSS